MWFIQPGVLHDVLCIEYIQGDNIQPWCGCIQQCGSSSLAFSWCAPHRIHPRWQYTTLMYPFPNLQSVSCSIFGSSCCFSCIQVSQETAKVVWYSHPFRNFPHFAMIHTVKGFLIVNEVAVDNFWNYLALSMFQQIFTIWYLLPLPFLNPACTSGGSWFT